MSQIDVYSPPPPPLQPTTTNTATIIPTQADHTGGLLRTSTVDIGGKEERRYHQGLNEQRSQQDDVELVWEREQHRLKEREEIQDKFATLFEPPTPRASPTLLPSSLPPAAATTNLPLFSRHTILRRHSSRIFRPGSNSSSDFGSFVEVKEDPLSFAHVDEQPGEGKFTRGDATPSAANTVSSLLSSTKLDEAPWQRQALPSQHHSNKTLEFFDMFTYDAKQRSSAARTQVLDELLLHEDDPMWFVLGVSDAVGVANYDAADLPSLHASIKPNTTKDSDDTENRNSSKSFLLDIDHDYFRPSSVLSSHPSPRSLSPIRHRMPSRSSSIPPPAVAPPVACQLTASPPTGHHHEFDPLVNSGHLKPPIKLVKEDPDSSNQAQGLGPERSSSSLSSKLMSSLLRGSQPSPPSPSPSSKLADTRPFLKTTSDHSEEHTSALTIDTRHPLVIDDSKPPRPLALSSTDSIFPALEGHATHFSVSKQRNPFAPAIVTHSASPFASTVYSSPSGAPGFKGDRYDWDKGFSDALQSELKGHQFAFASDDLHDSSESDGNRSSMIGSRAGWGTGFGFRTVRAGKPNSKILGSSSPVPVHSNEQNGYGREKRTTPLIAQEMGSDRADLQDHDSGYNRHEGLLSSTSSTVTGSVGGMGDLIERKVRNIELVGRRVSSDSILMPELASMLHAHLPALSRLPRSWVLIYSLDQHGISLNTLYSRCEAHLSQNLVAGDPGVSKGMLLVIKDGGAEEKERAIFGAWIAEGLKLNKGKGYSGGGESFLWKYVDGILKVFKATGKNNYVALCEPDYISFGGGDGHYGLYLDDTLFEGSSASCPTFDNEPLCTGRVLGNLRTAKFECLGLEVWGMA